MSIQEDRPKSARAKRQPAANNHPAPENVVQPSMRQHWTDAAGLPLLPDEQPLSTVRDSLYDLIPLGPREEKLIGTAPFLRLQKIKQLGFVYRIWPGATHTRYEHSLGCYNLAVRALRALLQHGSAGGLDGGVDVARLQESLRIHPNVQGQRRVVVTHKGISPLHSLLHARQEMFDNIYWHHTSRAFQVM